MSWYTSVIGFECEPDHLRKGLAKRAPSPHRADRPACFQWRFNCPPTPSPAWSESRVIQEQAGENLKNGW